MLTMNVNNYHARFRRVSLSVLTTFLSTIMSSIDVIECRICYSSDGQLLSPCLCSGTVAYIHYNCLKQCVEINGEIKCRICGQNWIGFEVIAIEKDFFDYLEMDEQMKSEFYGLISLSLLTFFWFSVFVCIKVKLIIENYNKYVINFNIDLPLVLYICLIYNLIKVIINNYYVNYKIWKKFNTKYKIHHVDKMYLMANTFQIDIILIFAIKINRI